MTLAKRFAVIFLLSVTTAGMMACSSSEEISSTPSTTESEEAVFERVDREETIIPETDLPADAPPSPAQEAPKIERSVPMQPPSDLPASQETPVAAPKTQIPEKPVPLSTETAPGGTMMWSVQLGAFKSESGALQLIDEVKKKFNQPVYKRYDAVTGFYKVTLGSYQNREDAGRFKLDVQSRGYPDAFVVEVAR